MIILTYLKILVNNIADFILIIRLRLKIGTIYFEDLGEKKHWFERGIWLHQGDMFNLVNTTDELEIIRQIQKISEFKHEQSLVEVKSAKLVGKCAIGLDSNFRILLPTVLSSRKYVIKSGDAKWILIAPFMPSKKIDVAISLVGVLSKSYFHWIMEYLPNLQYWFEYTMRTGIKPKIIIDSSAPSFQREYLELLGINSDHIIEWKTKKMKVKNLIIPSSNFTRMGNDLDHRSWYLYHKTGSDWLKQKLLHINYNPKMRIYISRADSDRIVVNESELVALLKSFGIEKVVLSDYSVNEQIALFQNAELVVGAHGAGLVNLIFAENCKVLELFPKERSLDFAHVFYQISSLYQHEHILVGSESDAVGNIQADLTIVNRTLNTMMK